MKHHIILIKPRFRDVGCLCLLSFIVFTSVTIAFVVSAFTYDSSTRWAGTVKATQHVTQYGFGPDKRLLVLNISEIGGVSNIDDYDKKMHPCLCMNTENYLCIIKLESKLRVIIDHK